MGLLQFELPCLLTSLLHYHCSQRNVQDWQVYEKNSWKGKLLSKEQLYSTARSYYDGEYVVKISHSQTFYLPCLVNTGKKLKLNWSHWKFLDTNSICSRLLSVGRYPAFSCQSPMNAMCWPGSRVCSDKVFIHPVEPVALCILWQVERINRKY